MQQPWNLGDGTIAPQRHGCLTAILVVFGLTSVIAVGANFALHDRLVRTLPNTPQWAYQALIAKEVLGPIAVAALVGLWFWKRWALYVYIVAALAVFVLNIPLKGLVSSLRGLVGVALVVIFVARQWKDFR